MIGCCSHFGSSQSSLGGFGRWPNLGRGNIALSKAWWRRRVGKTSEGLDSGEQSHSRSEDDECPIDNDGGTGLGACLKVKHRRVDETEWDTKSSELVHQVGRAL